VKKTLKIAFVFIHKFTFFNNLNIVSDSSDHARSTHGNDSRD
jgi:hypothetical protein